MILSIITPVFNGAPYLKGCLENVASQFQEGIEHLVVDGGSNDGTVEILKDYESRFNHIRWVSEKDSGQSDAMNKGLKMAKGDWVGFLNVDDFYEQGALEKVVNHILSCQNKELILTGILRIVGPDGELIRLNSPDSMTLARMLADTCEWPYNPSAYFYPRRIHEIIGYFLENEHFAMDYDFILRAWVHHIPFKFVPEIWGNFRLLPDAKTSQDQLTNQSYIRSQTLRETYFRQLRGTEKWKVRLEKLRWWCVLKWRKYFQ